MNDAIILLDATVSSYYTERAARRERIRAQREADAYRDCHSFGINDGCKPECPVFQRGECEMQTENAALFGVNPTG